jgi:hypothetical protein
MNLRALPMDFPGLSNNYTQVLVDANYAQTGAPNWQTVETISVGRNASNMITSTQIAATIPIPILRATATMTGNVYTSLVEIQRPAGYRAYQRETVWTNGGALDTASMLETYDTVSSAYVNSDRWTTSYDAGNRIIQTLHSVWTNGAWSLREKRVFGYSGSSANYASDTTYSLSGGNWTPSKYNRYAFSSAGLDSVTLYQSSTGTFSGVASYRLNHNAGASDTMINYSPSSSTFKPSTRIIFKQGSTPPPAQGVGTSISSTEFEAYPNPANSFVTVMGKAPYAGTTIVLTDATGRSVRVVPMRSSNQEVSLQGLASGLYLITVQQEGTLLYRGRLMVNH